MTFLTGTLKIMEALLTLLVTPVLFLLEKVHPCISTPILLYYLVRQKKTWYVPKCSVWNAVYQKYQDVLFMPSLSESVSSKKNKKTVSIRWKSSRLFRCDDELWCGFITTVCQVIFRLSHIHHRYEFLTHMLICECSFKMMLRMRKLVKYDTDQINLKEINKN